MTTTMTGIIRRAGALVPERAHVARQGGQTALTATSGAAQTLIDTVGYPYGITTTYMKDRWLWNLTQGLVRKVSSTTEATGTYTHAGAAWAAPASGDIYMVLLEHPEIWMAAVNEALQTLLTTRTLLEWTPTDSDQDDYSITAAPISATNVQRDSQIFAVEYRPADDANARWEPWNDGFRTWQAYMDGETVRISFGDLKPSTADKMRFTLLQQFAPVTNLTTSIAVDEEWAAYGTLLAMARVLKQNKPGDEWTRIERDIAAPAYDGRRRAILGGDGYRQVGRNNQRGGILGVGGRGYARGGRRWQ